ncbi:MAG: lipopolysaccharide biosynthesis protein [Deltaproteobacteria bacterium]|nr:MAG: lipopolysaccharide biosynthesis protein [Deltaproteobacteria bacterium]
MASGGTSSLGRSGALLGVAKLWFLVSAYAITVGLTHLVPPSVYGRYYVVARIVAVPNLVLVYTMLFAVSRPMAAQFEAGVPAYFALRRRGVKLAAGLGGVVSLAFFAAAAPLARLLRDADLAAPLAVVAPISLVYALYAVNLGTLNALRRFPFQASLDIFMATTKAALILGAAAAGASLAAVVGGFTAASVLSLLLSVLLVARVGPPAGADRSVQKAPPMAGFAGALVVFTICVNLLQSADVLIVKRYVASDLVGFYSSAQQVALVPLSLMNAVSLLLFPLVASLEGSGDRTKVAAYLSETMRVATLLLAFMASVGAAAAPEIQALLFPRAYGTAAGDLRLLVWGFSGIGFAITMAWVLNSTGRTRPALIVVALPLLAVGGLGLALVPAMGTAGAARTVLVAGGFAYVAAAWVLRRTFGARVPAAGYLKVAVCAVAVTAVAAVLPPMSGAGVAGKLLIVARLALLAAVFLGTAFVLRALTPDDLRRLRRGA